MDLFQNPSPGAAYDENVNLENVVNKEHTIFKFYNEEENEDIEEEKQDKKIGIFHMHQDQYHFTNLYTEAEILGEVLIINTSTSVIIILNFFRDVLG